MNELGTAIITRVESVPMTIWDQRSALGMARSWIENQKDLPATDEYYAKLFERRDKLAADVVKMLGESGQDQSEMIETLRDVRREMDAPFVDERMLGFQAGRRDLLKPGERKKAAKASAEA